MKRTFVILAALAAVLSSCSKDVRVREQADSLPDYGIGFKLVQSPLTRAAETTAANMTSFKVTAIGNGVNFFTGENVTVSAGACTMDKTYYWPAYELGFFAYSNESGGTAAITNASKKINGVTPVAAAADQKDFVVAYNTGTKAANMAGGVPLNFRHALSQIIVNAQNLSTAGITISVNGVKVGNVKTSGDFTYPATVTNPNNGSTLTRSLWNVSSAASGSYTVTGTAAAMPMASAGNMMFGGTSWMLVPQQLTAWDLANDKTNTGAGSYIALNVQIKDGAGNQLYPATAGQYAWTNVPVGTEWEPGKCYTYTLNFLDEANGGGAGVDDNGDPVLGSPIAFTLMVDDWDPVRYESDMNTPPTQVPSYLAFEAKTSGTIVWKSAGSVAAKTIQYSKNGGEWIDITSSTTGAEISVAVGDVVRFKGNNTTYATSSSDYTYFTGTADFYVYGDVQSLMNFNSSIGGDYGFVKLFAGNTHLYSHPSEKFIASASTLKKSCYRGMFSGCTHLTKSLKLLATTLASSCYREMFDGCVNLTIAPELPVTTLANYCYNNMFKDCTSLTMAPELLATSLVPDCYSYMFSGCTSLTSVPSLPAMTLANFCYDSMFSGCTSLTSAPELPATILVKRCYSGMFDGCTNLVEAPELPATTLVEGCYGHMFSGCTSLAIAPELPATTLIPECYMRMFEGCTNLVEAPELPATTLAQSCYMDMFEGCTSLTVAPELPATALALQCYSSMFEGCTSLVVAPELPATTLVQGCYSYMFKNCTNLSSITCLATNISATSCTYDWVVGVASSGTFTKHPSMSSWSFGTSRIPSGWTVVDASI